MSRERDSALQTARGGSKLRRNVCAAKWFAIGANAGAVAAKLARQGRKRKTAGLEDSP